MRFNRHIGDFSGQRFTVTGEKISEEAWQAYAPTVLPTSADDDALKEYFKNPDWIAPKGNLA